MLHKYALVFWHPSLLSNHAPQNDRILAQLPDRFGMSDETTVIFASWNDWKPQKMSAIVDFTDYTFIDQTSLSVCLAEMIDKKDIHAAVTLDNITQLEM